jgi:hypothetical protein
VLLEQMEHREQMEHKATQAHKELKDLRVHKDQKEQLAHKDQKALKELLGQTVLRLQLLDRTAMVDTLTDRSVL